ncbi:HAD family hydrolase [Breznakiella homolactica]|uniref:HAD family phosphatase n=1 Tax=Breznakiella homolactica TaxID=2798577 RepID=A0A7T7XJH5_9SPIR|nr:HAD family phosphatase [Breznakiella homolactica]QQO07511.1 HAD family phosphatase [Breznakiella homolactica]
MIKLCIFDMGGVMIRDFQIGPRLIPYLGYTGTGMKDIDPKLQEALGRHGRGCINEKEFWEEYTKITGRNPPENSGRLLGKFFTPVMDDPTVRVVQELKDSGMRVVAGTNVIDAHYEIHMELGQYAIFDKVYASNHIGISKPDPEFYSYIVSAEGVQPGESFFTDDIQENVDAAAELGLAAFLYTDAQSLRSQLVSAGALR